MATWTDLQLLKRSDFKNPDGLRFDIVRALDAFSGALGVRPLVLSDFREGDPRQHGQGTAVDVTFPGLDPIEVFDRARAAMLFSGIGIYVNNRGVPSFHFDRRNDRTVSNPALWGGLIRSYTAEDQGELRGDTLYVTAERVLVEIKKKAGIVLVLLAGAVLLWMIVKS